MNSSDLPFSDRVKKIGELLKSADRHILAGDFDKAIEDVEKVFDFDPKNIYAKAYLNRIEVFRKQKEKKHNELPRPHIEPPVKEASPSKTKATLEEERKLIEEIIAKEAEKLPVSSNHQVIKAAPSKKLSEEERKEKQYLEKLEIAWSEGKVPQHDEANLEKLREELGISPERHKELERRVKLSSYVRAVKTAWEEGAITPTGAQILEDLREQYDVSLEEHLKIESRIMYELHGLKSKGIVMIIDDDKELVKVIKTILRDEGYATFSASTPEDGLQILEDTLPDLILLDITFPKPSMSGFTMYERLRKHPRLKLIPVVFFTGLDEEYIMQIGKKLGADDYVVKPCSDHMLLSTVEGKVKRYKEIREMIKERG